MSLKRSADNSSESAFMFFELSVDVELHDDAVR